MTFKPVVSSHGYGDASIYFLTGFPLSADIQNGIALCGHSENTLNSFLRPHGITVKQTYRASFIREKLAYSGTSTRRLREALNEVDVNAYENLLKEEIKEVAPNVVVPLDDIALGVVYPHIKTIRKPKGRKHWVYCYRGSILRLREDWQSELRTPVKIIPTISPQLLYNDAAARAYASIDFARIVRFKDSIGPVPEYGLRWVCRTALEFRNFINRSINEAEFLTFDIETYFGLITCISFCFNGFEGVSIPINDSKVPIAERALLWQLTAKLLAHPIPKVNQNIKYDWTILERHGFYVNNVTGDTMVAGGLIYPELSKGLDFYTSVYTQIPYYKDEGKEYDPRMHTRDKLYLYNAQDSIAAHVVHTEELKELEELNMLDLYQQELVPLIKVYKDIDAAGILVDGVQKAYLNEKYLRLYESNKAVLCTLINNDKFNPKSWQQCGKLIYEELKFPARTKTNDEGKKVWKTDKETLDDLMINHPQNNKLGEVGYAILARIIVCRKLAKVLEYINTPLHPDGRLHGTSNLSGTDTGRSSFSKTIDEAFIIPDKTGKFTKRLGRSLQTISKHGFHIDEEVFDDFEDANIAADLRSMFVPTPGYVFVEIDGAGAEAREVCVLAEDYDALEAMDKKPKIHARTAGAIFGIDPNTITKDEPKIPKIGMAYYDLGKRIRHAGNYSMGPGRLTQMSHLDFNFCKRALDTFHEQNPKIRGVFHDQVVKFLQKNHFLVTPFGRRRDFFGGWSDEIIKKAIAYIPQSTISDQTKFTLRRVNEELGEQRYLAEMHDGVLAEIKKGEEMAYAKCFKRHYERPISHDRCSLYRDFKLIIPAEVSIGDENWMSLQEVKV